MTVTYRATLPGEPLTHAEQNAQAHVNDILGLWHAYHFDPAKDQRSDLDPHANDIIAEYGWDVSEMTAADLRDAVTQVVYETPLSCRYSMSWDVGSAPNASEPEEMEIVLTTGGPALWIVCSFGHANIICCPMVICSEHGTGEVRYHLNADETLAIQWFCGLLAA